MGAFAQKLTLLLSDSALRNRLLFVAGALAVFRVFASIPIPGINASQLQLFLSNNQFFGLLNLFSGGGLSNLSIVMLGVGPYITASIIMQLLTMMIPRIKQMYQEEGEAGRAKFAQYSRYLTLPIALVQGSSFLLILERQGVFPALTPLQFGISLLVITAGSMLLMWIGELISEFGLGNGVSVVIFAGIVASLPQTISQTLFTFDPTQIPLYVGFIVATVAVTAAVVALTEAERPVPVTYAKRIRGMKFFGGSSTYLPLRLNQAGVIPIIFALSLLLIPQMFASFFAASKYALLATVSNAILGSFQNLLFYGALYFIFVFFFTYFYTAVTFDPHLISENLQKSGAFIPGVRPGVSTSEYLGNIITRITFVGALFLGIIAVLPIAMQQITGIQSLTLGGTALLIVVSVVLDLARRIDAQISIREY
ncbi:preprotein translocase subunit SecY [Candidatus Adlerbacteria bacterium RIFCSPHIGHO2_02_FULL_52_17]|uniref:Protein translocase subunit SecY n=1 Tax=Candidatus Adlerbacteria bacterium RIFCSPHIGHO2_02_FULL_52_17 TaxID=1797240 RepID=A0A1F4XQS0_9BACT|nr:MAG: preprotein translocase subunit SecY [Candidatus Adlerbacteria bacterium RIFCSPHIGHO2_02_FULL_52_17]